MPPWKKLFDTHEKPEDHEMVVKSESPDRQKFIPRIVAVGIGGAGGNAINNMITSNLSGLDFFVANTNAWDLDKSLCPHKMQLGPSVTMGLAAGADPDIGRMAAEESITEIREAVGHFDMVFIVAGMGGGTGTGASPVVAHESRGNGALTLAVVTTPFKFEGEPRIRRAMEGIKALKEEVDSLIIIPNECFKSLGGNTTPFRELFKKADEFLLQTVKGISDLLMSSGFINLDFADVKKVMGQLGTVLMGMGKARGENRTCKAAQNAINSPLLKDISIEGTKGLLINISGPPDMTWDEVDQACNYIKDEVNDNAEVFFGMVFDENLQDEVLITVIATGIDGCDEKTVDSKKLLSSEDGRMDPVRNPQKAVNIRQATTDDFEEEWTVRKNGINLDTPTWQREKFSLSTTMDNDAGRKSKKGFFEKFKFKKGLDYPTFLRDKPSTIDSAKNPDPEFEREVSLRNVMPEDIEEKWTIRRNGANIDEPILPGVKHVNMEVALLSLLSRHHKRIKKKKNRLLCWLFGYKKANLVDCTVFAPPSVAPKADFLIQAFAHLPDEVKKVIGFAKQFDEDTEIRGYTNLEIRVERNSRLGFHLYMPGLSVNEDFQSLTWIGRPGAVQFHVSVPKDIEPGTVVGKVTVSQRSVPVGHIIFKIKIVPTLSSWQNEITSPVGETSKAYTTAFVSYASEDRNKVLPRVQMLKIFGIKYFQDIFDLSPGDRWRRRLFTFIDRADLFLLFWSSNSAKSQWVRKETQYALARKGEDDAAPPEIIPVIIEAPPPLPPWEELRHLHFNDREIYFELSSS